MDTHPAPADEPAAYKKQHCTAAVQGRIDSREERVFGWYLHFKDIVSRASPEKTPGATTGLGRSWTKGVPLITLHAAGFVVRRFTMMNASPNMKAENKISVAMDPPSANASVPGYSRLRRASTP